MAFVLLGAAGACSNDVSNLFGGAGGTGTGTDATTAPATSGTDATGSSGTGDTSTTATASGSGSGSSSTGVLPTCGNGTIEAPEQCDGANVGAFTCVDGGFSKPDGVGCDDNCQITYKGCSPSCGDNNPEPGEECDDGNLQSGDGCSAICKNEVDPCGAPQQIALALGAMTLMGTTAGPSFHTSSCQADGPESVYEVTPAADGYMTAWLTNAGTAFDSVVYVRSSCDGEEIVCNDNEGNNNRGGDVVSFPVQGGVPLYLFVDGFGNAQSGSFTLELDLSSGEDCDDPIPLTIELNGDVTVVGNTGNHSSDAVSSGDCMGAGGAADLVYDVHFANGGGERHVSSSAAFNSVLHARTACDEVDTELQCSSVALSNDASITFDEDDAFVWIDGTQGQVGSYSLDFN